MPGARSAMTDFHFGKEDFYFERTHQLLWAEDSIVQFVSLSFFFFSGV